MKFFMPKQSVFFTMFNELTDQLSAMSTTFSKGTVSLETLPEAVTKARDIEHAADQITHKIIDQLNSTFITPIDREDIYELVKELDEIVDLIENALHNMQLCQVKEMHPAVKEFSALIQEASKELGELVHVVNNPKKRKECQSMVIKIHELEDKGDIIFQNAIEDLFKNHQSDVLYIVQWKDILEDLENVMDQFQAASDTIESVIVKAS